ncbi:oligopeptide ABC transporter nucleotide binding/ATPase protein [Nitratireductor aquibiodomus RA22]|uniref:Oligopeptide ABC transporter nucleotide binding/ATPase protein n=1 Tax=Nitratireductor aquibiodomus RA22 TaxID=1189611 RepID=I5BQN9_9HYPH|nr:ABC transporter ATP-binding protein [Nitratireductor aquibiodomus]EIM71891.1 oligopeptide ABC transporter nucleotide binding/ATPase protein [Nitratireductor aquibiodomus RA22]
MGEADKPVIDVRGLRVEFPGRRGSVTALSDVSLSIKAGEILGVVGESGAGKSMTGLAIQGLLERPGHISGGEIWLAGRRIDQLDDRAMEQIRGREVGAIFQDPLTSLNPLFTVGAQLGETIRQHLPVSKREAKQRAIQLLRDVGIPSPEERVKQYPHQFSGGMRQRVVIALALAASPKLVIADEPTTALDVSIQAQVISLLRKLCKEKQTAVMLVTHDMGVIAEAADRVAVMYAGRLIELGPVEQVLHAPRHPYTQGLMASIPSLDGRVEKLSQIDGSMPRLDAIPTGCAFNPRCGHVGPLCLKERPELTFAGEGASACWLNAGGTA